MSTFENKVIVITGATSGIGRALAIAIAAKGVQLVLAARRIDELNAVKAECEALGALCRCIFIDMAAAASIDAFAAEVNANYGKVDVLINNAGISQRSLAEDTPVDVDRRIMEVNFFGQVALTKALWPSILKSSHANIVIISSVVGTFGFPQRSAYSASKHALEGFFESWNLENQHNNVHFTTVSPGRVYTNISYAALKADGTQHQQLDEGQVKGIRADVCAGRIVKGIVNNRRRVYIVQQEMVLVILRKCFPWLFFKLVKKLKLS